MPAVPGGAFWDPEGDEILLAGIRRHLRADIALETIDLHINDPELGRHVAERFLELMEAAGAPAHPARPRIHP